ncbi:MULTISPECIES: beta-ketoacyl-ACP synthase II [unclassified Paenibacillus]|uniref:beta-ketoacyl-ACP synthase II n=1 Tax=unclassified Paenibacillus TaxID=185978 RepID=UPI001C0FF9EE|nr:MULTISPECIES: beta-ketoacyl-ACP synthase II [unclassified Paenibacillus]MBU5442709.1 beta-ketoacyl-ACP synthase II [Paenibacillus sp. MSJ-34]CAH0120972.1 3-oxoacyl-[acyl-carrier-protein] synthase 2 [Paenibacillus sp. CECT 9249]
MTRVVVTGMGVISPLGNDVPTFWSKLANGESAISTIDTFDISPYKSKIAGIVRGFDAEKAVGSRDVRRMDRFCQFAVAASKQAIEDAALNVETEDKERIGVYIGSGVGGLQTLLDNYRTLLNRGPGRVSPTVVPMMIANMAAAQVSIMFGFTGPTLAPVTACASSNNAIGEAYKLIQRGGADVVIAGGAEATLTDLALAGFGNATALSTRNDEPERASRPFDAERDGFVPSEGAGVLVLESYEHARRREARIHAEVIGYGASSDAYHMVATEPEGTGAYRAMKEAVQDAAISAEQIDCINAHATSTPLGDLSETLAIKKLLGSRAYDIPVTANKSMLGHLLGAAGGVEAIALIKSLQEGLIPPTINLEHPDPQCDLDYVPNRARKANPSIGLSNSFGFGGHNAVIILKKYE